MVVGVAAIAYAILYKSSSLYFPLTALVKHKHSITVKPHELLLFVKDVNHTIYGT